MLRRLNQILSWLMGLTPEQKELPDENESGEEKQRVVDYWSGRRSWSVQHQGRGHRRHEGSGPNR